MTKCYAPKSYWNASPEEVVGGLRVEPTAEELIVELSELVI